MGISCKPMGKMRGHFQKMDNKTAKEKSDALKRKPTRKKEIASEE